jgi:plasmid stability protein
MPILHVRNVPESLYLTLQQRARSQGRSLSSEVIILLEDAVRHPPRSQSDILSTLADRRRQSQRPAGTRSVVDLIR